MLHHEASTAAFVASARDTARCDAVIVAGSVARGTERPNSDIDLYLLVTEQAFAAARAGGTLSTVEGDSTPILACERRSGRTISQERANVASLRALSPDVDTTTRSRAEWRQRYDAVHAGW